VAYVDGFLLAIPKSKLDLYKSMSKKAGRVWREHGALDYKEAFGDDLTQKKGATFPKRVKLKRGEVVIFAYILYKSRSHRDAVNKKVMKDPRLAAMMNPNSMPFDMKRMSYAGFKVFVDE
jgi:uncharacterized protein YbaA (DUF1428 family)